MTASKPPTLFCVRSAALRTGSAYLNLRKRYIWFEWARLPLPNIGLRPNAFSPADISVSKIALFPLLSILNSKRAVGKANFQACLSRVALCVEEVAPFSAVYNFSHIIRRTTNILASLCFSLKDAYP